MNLSQIGTILYCPAYVRLSKERKRQKCQAALDGIDLHKEAQDCLLGLQTSNKPEVNQYVEFVNGYKFNGVRLIEHKLTVPSIHPEARGILDAGFYNSQSVCVIDYKTGWAEVEAVENYQLISYAKGLIDSYAPEATSIRLVIVQPKSRISVVKQWVVFRSELESYVNKLRKAAALSDEPNPPVKTGKHCINCDHKNICPAISKTLDILGDICETRFEDCEEYNVAMRIKQLKYLLKLAEKSLILEEEKAVNELSNGNEIPGLRLGVSKGQTTWKNHEEALRLLKVFGKLDPSKAIITPKQAIAAGIPQSMVDKLSETSGGKVKLMEI